MSDDPVVTNVGADSCGMTLTECIMSRVKTHSLVVLIVIANAAVAERLDSPDRQTSVSDERTVLQVIADRQAAWNAGDEQAYARLLTEDADLATQLSNGPAACSMRVSTRAFVQIWRYSVL